MKTMKTIHYYSIAAAVTVSFFGLLVLVSSMQPISAPVEVSGQNSAQKPTDGKYDPTGLVIHALSNQDQAHADHGQTGAKRAASSDKPVSPDQMDSQTH